MGNAPTCIDCSKDVPKLVRVVGGSIYNYFTKRQWIWTGNEYICPDCLVKRQNKQRMVERGKKEQVEKMKRKQQIKGIETTEIHEMKEQQEKQHDDKETIKETKNVEVTIKRTRNKRTIKENHKKKQLGKEKWQEGIENVKNNEKKKNHNQKGKLNNVTEAMITKWVEQRIRTASDHNTINSKRQILCPQNVHQRIESQFHRCRTISKEPESEVQIDISYHETSENININLYDIYNFLSDKPVGKHFDMSSKSLLETCKLVLMKLQNKYAIVATNVINVEQEVMQIFQTSFNDACVMVMVLLLVLDQQSNSNSEMHTFHFSNQYRLKQENYKGDGMSTKTLLRQFCDALVLLHTDTSLSRVSTNISNIFNRFFISLLEVCFENDCIRSSINLIKSQQIWCLDDLLCLLWIVHTDCDRGEKILHFISSFQYTPNELLSNKMTIKESIMTWNSKELLAQLNMSCKEETHKTISNVLDDMENSGTINSQSKIEICCVLETVYNTLKDYGYPNKLPRNWSKYGKMRNWSKYGRMLNWKTYEKMRKMLNSKQIADLSEEELILCISEICRCVKDSKGYWPRCTQLISLYLLIKANKNGCLLEINTGEGKTCIVAMFAVFLAMSGKSVDIVSSSPLLAQRDLNEWSDFYKKFNVSVTSNLTQTESEERLECYRSSVVYGTIGSFASDILRQEFFMENVRGSRVFDAVIVDEVDCLLLDQAMHCTYLSNASPGMHHLEPILLMIWNEVIRHPMIKSDRNQHYFLEKAEPFHVFLSSLINVPKVSEYDDSLQIIYLLEMAKILPEKFTSHLIQIDVINNETNTYKSTLTKVKMFECFQWIQSNFDIAFEIYEILNDSIIQQVYSATPQSKGQTVKVLITGEGLVCGLYEDKETLCALIQSKIAEFVNRESGKPCYSLPCYLSEFVKNRLPSLINNAFTAINMTPGREYLIKDKNIVPVDFESTGVVELETKWGDGLHQFLEIKHKKRLSQLAIVTNFMSNQRFFNKYPNKIFGVSGTLGTSFEVSYLKRTFGLKLSKIPTFRPKKHFEIPGEVCSCKKEWLSRIQSTVEEQICKKAFRGMRAVLVVCEDINTTEDIKNCLKSVKYSTLTTYTGENTDDLIPDKKLRGGDVIIATNIAGRGTDIEIDNSVVDAGGLFVLVTFLPKNKRVENQVFGRSARKGQSGSSQIILNKEHLQPHLQFYSDIYILKQIRDDIEHKRMAEIEENLLSDIKPKEDLFYLYCQYVHDKFSFLDEMQKSIVLGSMHEFWGLWLKMKSECIGKQNLEDVKKDLADALDKAKRHIMQDNSPCANIYHIVKFANEKLSFNDFKEAEILYTKAINCDSEWAAIAYYNRAYCVVRQEKEGYLDKAIEDLKAAKEGFCNFKEEVLLSLSLIGILHSDTNAIKQTSEIETQFQTRCQIVCFFEENIETSLKALFELKLKNQNAETTRNNVFTYVVGNDKICKKIDSEMYVFWELGMTDILTIREKLPFCWKGLFVAMLGVMQIALGTIIIASTVGALTNIGWCMVTEGINDICTGAYAIYNRDQHFVKSWLTGKAISITISIATAGLSKIKMATKGSNGIKASMSMIKAEMKSASKEIISTVTKIPGKTASKSFGQAFKASCKKVASHTGMKLAERGGQYLLDVTRVEIQKYFQNDLHKRVTCQFEEKLENKKMKDTLDKFVFVHMRDNKNKLDIVNDYKRISESLLTSQNGRKLGNTLAGCVVGLVQGIQCLMMKKDILLFERCKPLMDMITASQSKSYDVEKLVVVYCSHLEDAVNEIHGSKFGEITEELMSNHYEVIKEIKTLMCQYSIDYVCAKITEFFNCTSERLLAENLQTVVGGLVSEFNHDSVIGKDTIQNVLAISQKGLQLADSIMKKDISGSVVSGIEIMKAGSQVICEDEATKKEYTFMFDTAKRGFEFSQSPSIKNLSHAIFETANDGVETFMQGETKQQTKFVINSVQTVIQANEKDNTMTKLQASAKIVGDGIDTFTSGKIKETSKFALKAVTESVESLQTGDAKKVMKSSLDIFEDGIDTFASETTKDKAKFAVRATKQGVKLLESGDTEDIKETTLEVAEDIIETFASENTKAGAKFAVKATKHCVKALKSTDAKEILKTSFDIIHDGTDAFASEAIKEKAKFAVKATKEGMNSMESGNTNRIINAALDITADGIDKFADETIKEKAMFFVKATKQGANSLESGDMNEIINATLDISHDGIVVFANKEIKEPARCAVKTIKQGVNSPENSDTHSFTPASELIDNEAETRITA